MNSMNYIGKFISNFRDFYNEINTATLTGAIDVVVVEQPDGTFNCSPFHVRFGKLGVLRSREKVVDMEVNGEPLDIHMKLGESGEAFFVEELSPADLADEEIPPHLACSPIPSETFLSRHPLLEEEIPHKTFRAETVEGKVSEKVRRISLVSGEFRPIESDRLEAEMGVAKPSLELQEKWPEKPTEGARPNAGAMGKRKRRKKSLIKKKGSKKGGAREVQDQQASENIFVIDDLDPSLQPAEVNVVPNTMVCTSAPQMAENNFHFFSDTELTPESSPVASPSSPTQSDTELERVRHSMGAPADEGQSWRWGELPSPPPRSLQDEQPTNQDLGDDDDAESGNGTSLPHSPQSVEGAIGGPKHSEAELELMKHSIFDENAAMSLCGGLEGPGPSNEAFLHGLVTYEDLCSNPKLLESPELVVRLGGKYYSWGMACSVVMSALLYQRPLPQTAMEHVCESPKDAKGGYASWFSWRRPVEAKPADKLKPLGGEDEQLTLLLENNGVNAPPNGLTFTSQSNFNSTIGLSDAIPMLPDLRGSHSSDGSPNGMYERVHRKTLRLTSEQIASLRLKEGANEVMFSVTTAYQGTTRCKCHIYKWRYDDRIVISDIDGTITKSDVLGHILPIVGKDWAQSGVAQLFTKIKNNGYKLLYLSARAIGQARVTREYLRSIKQGDLSLPDGPLLLNPTSLVSAFHREVIERKPEEFKISCLRDIQALFPADTKPFYAGYGNKVNDVWAYRAVGIPIFRIFTINHRGELKHELTQTFQSSYSNMSYIVDQMFPPSPAIEASEDYSSFVYWRDPIADVPIIDTHTPIEKKLVPQPIQ